MFLALRGEQERIELSKGAPSLELEDIKQRVLTDGFDYTKDTITATVLGKRTDEDGNPALELEISWPPNSPIYDTNVVVTMSCSPLLSNLVYAPQEGQLRGEVAERGINVYEKAKVNDALTAFCSNEYCSEIGGACEITRQI